MPTATAAQAPVPQASVSPAPRSQTRSRIARRDDDLHEAGVDAPGEAHVLLDARPLRRDRREVDVGDDLHRVRVAHRDDGEIDGAALAELDRPERQARPGAARRQPGDVERNVGRLEIGRPHVDADAAVVLAAQREAAVHGLDDQRLLSLSPLSRTKAKKQRAPLPQCSTSSPLPPLKMR